eukprot:TRINITY_DN1300_c0_g1_i1.p1 TRINITY_DN1300_c0_g1~~TRINITY_DN1300_c0_g1_i1.p1  ORF type:complete len:566 (-),score=90.61 TRINITY_DN1300_c0_g1_i1:2158-3855(-)
MTSGTIIIDLAGTGSESRNGEKPDCGRDGRSADRESGEISGFEDTGDDFDSYNGIDSSKRQTRKRKTPEPLRREEESVSPLFDQRLSPEDVAAFDSRRDGHALTTPNIAASRWAKFEIQDDDDHEVEPKRSKVSSNGSNSRSSSHTPESRMSNCSNWNSDAGERASDFMREETQALKGDILPSCSRDEGKLVDEAEIQHFSPDLSDIESSPPLQMTKGFNMMQGCRSVDEFERLNKVSEGTYGIVYRARDKKTGEIVALKKVKMERQREGFPISALREINILLSLNHPSIVNVKEVVIGSDIDKVFMVMEYMEHDLKGFLERRKKSLSTSEVKCLMLQLLEGVNYLHDNWVLHRDLKTSNLLYNNKGELKICDLGLSRQYGSPLKTYTDTVVTLWYRAPELLLGAKKYSTAIDMWSVGCIMAELMGKEPLFCGKTEIDQLSKIIKMLGNPNEKIWPDFVNLPGSKMKFTTQRFCRLREKFPAVSFSGGPTLTESGFDLLSRLLTYDPKKRITAQEALDHPWFREVPLPVSKELMPTLPPLNDHDRHSRRYQTSPDPLVEQCRKES